MGRRTLTGRFRRGTLGLSLALLAAGPVEATDVPVTLRGSWAAMQRQHGVALDLGYTFARSSSEIARLEAVGDLVRMAGNADYAFREGVASAVARPEMRLFIERLAREYRQACGEKLVVTSLTRPLNRQPRNAHRLSVHPAGIAVDLRVSRSAPCRGWLEDRLLEMERGEVLDVTRERLPPHYHVALFPDGYMTWVQPQLRAEAEAARAAAEAAAAAEAEWAAARAALEDASRPEGRKRAGLLLALLVPAGAGLFASVRLRRKSPGAGRPLSSGHETPPGRGDRPA